jgi:competence protein ComGC
MSNHSVIGIVCLSWFAGIIVILSKELIVIPKRIRLFTMMELIMVMVIMAFLLTMVVSIPHGDRSKAESVKIGNELKVLHQASLTYDYNNGDSLPFIFDQAKYKSNITLSHPDVFFRKGSIVDDTNAPIIGYNIEVQHKESSPIKVYVKPFTGKVTYH